MITLNTTMPFFNNHDTPKIHFKAKKKLNLKLHYNHPNTSNQFIFILSQKRIQ